jgi:hypothetical protein
MVDKVTVTSLLQHELATFLETGNGYGTFEKE